MNRPQYRNAKASAQDLSRQRRPSGRRSDSRRDDWREFDEDRVFEDEQDDDDFDAIEDAPHASEDDDDPFEGVARRAARARRRAAIEAERPREPSADEIAANAAALVSKRVSESERHTARALQNLTELIETGQRKLESTTIDRAVNSLEKRVVQSERHTAQALENIADIVERSRQNAVDPGAIESAVTAFDRRVGESERKTARALESIAELISAEAKNRSRGQEGFDVLLDRLGRIESKLAQPPAEPVAPRAKPSAPVPSRAAVEPRSPEFESALTGLDRRLAELAAKLDADTRRETRPAATAVSARALDRGLEVGARSAARPLADAILDITRRQAALDAPAQAQAQAPERRAVPFEETADFATSLAGKRFDELQDSVSALSRKMEGFQSGDGDRGEQMLAMTRQIESLRRQIDEASRGENPAMVKRFDDLRALVETLARKSEASVADKRFDDLQQAIGALTKRMENVRSAEGDRSDQLLVLTRQIEMLRSQVDEAGRGEPIGFGGRFAELRGVVDQLARQSDALREELGASAERHQRISRQVDNLREENLERQAEIASQIGDLRHELAELTQALGDLAPRASIASIETALRELIEHISEQRRQGVVDDALAPAERVAGELRAVLNDMDPAPRVQSLDGDLRRMAERIEELRAPGEANAATLRDLSHRTEEIKQILAALMSRPLPLEQIESRLHDLTQRVDRLSQSPQGPRGQRGSERVGEVSEAAKSIRAIIAAETEGNLDAFNQRLDRLSDKLEQALSRFGTKRFDELGARIDDMHRSITQRLDRSATHKVVDTSALENLVAGLAKKIDSALESGSRRGVEALEGKVERIHQKLDRIDFPSTSRIEELLTRNQPQQQREIRAIGDRLDEMQKALNARIGSSDVQAQVDQIRDISDRLEAMHGSLAARLEKGVRTLGDTNDLHEQHKQLRQISERLDSLCGVLAARIDEVSRERADSLDAQQQQKHFAELSERLDFMHHALAARIEEGSRQRGDASRAQLTDLVEQLARHANNAMDANADPEQVNALGEQLRDLSSRLDRSGEGAALASIETKIADLFARIEETRASATEAAEEAVRRATLDVLRQAGGALSPSVKEELDEIRQAQSESGARTHETLSAVHDTLERVVDRLAVFEEELSEIRSAAPSTAVASLAEARIASSRTEPLAARIKDRVEPQIAAAATLASVAAPAAAPRARRGRDVDDLDLTSIGTTSSARGAEPDTAVQANFIAAARRAAERAAADADRKERDELAVEPPQKRVAAGGGASAEAVASASGMVASIAARKRPIILGLTGVVLLVGALQLMPFIHLPGKHVATTEAHGGAELGAGAQDKIVAPAGPLAVGGQKDGASAPAKSGASTPDADSVKPPASATKPDGKSSLGEQVDQTPVGAIDRSGNVAQEPTSIAAAAARGDATAQYEMGVRFADGRAGSPRDAKTAAEWFGKAASQGMPLAQYRLGSFYEKGIGVERNTERARVLYQQAADAGNARAMHNLGVLYVEGSEGKPDYANASMWFRKAAEYGVRDSQFNLAILYARGLGVDQNLVQSYMWFSVAAAQGDADASKKRDDVGARLDTHDLATAKALVESFKAKELKRDANEAEPPRNNWQGFGPPAAPQLPPLMSPKPKVSRM